MAVGGLVKVKAGTGVWTDRMKYPPVQSNEEKTSSQCVRKGLVELSTIRRGSTDDACSVLLCAAQLRSDAVALDSGGNIIHETHYSLAPIGFLRSPLKDRGAAPNQAAKARPTPGSR